MSCVALKSHLVYCLSLPNPLSSRDTVLFRYVRQSSESCKLSGPLERRHEFERITALLHSWLVRDSPIQGKAPSRSIAKFRGIMRHFEKSSHVTSMSASSKRCHVGPVRAVNFHALLGQRRDFKTYRVFRQLVCGSPVRGEES